MLGRVETETAYAPRFAGHLSFGDYQFSGDAKTVSVGRQPPRAMLAEAIAAMPDSDGAHVWEMQERLHGADAPAEPGPYVPYVVIGLSPGDWGRAAGEVDERAVQQAARAAAETGLPAGPLDVWLMPVTEFVFYYLVVPKAA